LNRLQRRERLTGVQGAIGIHRDAARGEEARAGAVRDGAARAGGREIDRNARRRGVELGHRGEALLGKAVDVPAADAGDEVDQVRSRLHLQLGNARADHLLELGDRCRRLDDAYLVSWVLAAAQEVHVRVDESRDDARALEVHGAAARAELARVADARDATVADRERGRHAVARVHRQEAAVDQVYVGRGAAGGVAAIAIMIVVVVAPVCAGGKRHRRRGYRA